MDLSIGVNYITKKKYAEAEKFLLKALNEKKEIGLIYYYLGICCYHTENFPEALINFSQAIIRQIQIEDSYLKMGLIFFKNGDYIKSENYLNNSIKVKKNWYTQYLLGQIKLKNRQYEEAADHFIKSMNLCQDDSLIESQKGYIYSMIKLNKKEEAFIFFDKHLSKYSDKPEVFQLQARLHKELGDCSQALTLIDKALEMKPMNNLIMIGDRVTYNYYCQNYYECIKEGEELLVLLNLNPLSKYLSLMFYIGSSYLKLKNTAKGIKYIEEYEKLTQSDSNRLIDYFIEKASLVLDTTGDINVCLTFVNKALERKDEYLPALYMMNELELLSDNPDYNKYLNLQQIIMKKRDEGIKLPQIIPDVNLIINSLKEVNYY